MGGPGASPPAAQDPVKSWIVRGIPSRQGEGISCVRKGIAKAACAASGEDPDPPPKPRAATGSGGET